jgi:Xaa-Pro aminopeptidase
MADDGYDAVLVTGVSNLAYITGFEGVIDEGINAACLITADLARFYTDHRYTEAAGLAANGTPWEIRAQREELYPELCADADELGITSLVVEPSMPYARYALIQERFSGEARPIDGYVEAFREIKEPAEVEHIARAASIADRAFDHLCGFIAPGRTEAEIAVELEFFMRRNGSEHMPFAPIVAAGENGARPHAIPGSRAVRPGDLIVLDFGARFGGYCSDMTRTVAVGSAPEQLRRIYHAVLEANEAGLAAVRAGMGCREVDAAARAVLEAGGWGEYFTHGLGHGVGLDVHERPTVGRRSEETLRAGAVVTVEPGVYMAGLGGVRIEDLVVVTDDGHRRLTNAPKELIEI